MGRLRFHPNGAELALWFASAGLALITLGLLNLARRAAPYSSVRQLSAAGNMAGIACMLIVTALLHAPHMMLVLGMLVIATIRS